MCLSAVIPAFAEPDIHSLSQAHSERHRGLSVYSLPVLKKFGESLRSATSVAQSATCRTWQPARCGILLYFLSHCTWGIFERYELALSSINGEQMRHHLPSYGKCGSIGIPLLLFLFIDQSQIVILLGCQFRGFYQNPLNMLVALFGKRCAHHLIGSTLFITTQPTVTDGLSDRPETGNVPHLQGPGQSGNGAHARHGPEALDSFR